MNISKGETLIILRATEHGLQVTLFACLQISVENPLPYDAAAAQA